ncbi:hypothetical protein CYMTET_3009 [Cymbomonas tetramitiformis]|uniref:Uncharacterized protein n=1 Tax=Cymbomonas tetramitiformis TaxID=36881 RepID=A0AAE0H451_9CHLO|nr:hypothetical protein CYMTET_3009 [Cymbomonas tetramitiformis]
MKTRLFLLISLIGVVHAYSPTSSRAYIRIRKQLRGTQHDINTLVEKAKLANDAIDELLNAAQERLNDKEVASHNHTDVVDDATSFTEESAPADLARAANETRVSEESSPADLSQGVNETRSSVESHEEPESDQSESKLTTSDLFSNLTNDVI